IDGERGLAVCAWDSAGTAGRGPVVGPTRAPLRGSPADVASWMAIDGGHDGHRRVPSSGFRTWPWNTTSLFPVGCGRSGRDCIRCSHTYEGARAALPRLVTTPAPPVPRAVPRPERRDAIEDRRSWPSAATRPCRRSWRGPRWRRPLRG